MKELFYFSNTDLMIQVQNGNGKSLRYSSHREISSSERELIERYIRNNFATSIYDTSLLDYAGINMALEENLKQLQINNPKKERSETYDLNKADKAVKELIHESMKTYYFEEIGNLLVRIKETPDATDSIARYQSDLSELIEAYNLYSDKKVTLAEVLPESYS